MVCTNLHDITFHCQIRLIILFTNKFIWVDKFWDTDENMGTNVEKQPTANQQWYENTQVASDFQYSVWKGLTWVLMYSCRMKCCRTSQNASYSIHIVSIYELLIGNSTTHFTLICSVSIKVHIYTISKNSDTRQH